MGGEPQSISLLPRGRGQIDLRFAYHLGRGYVVLRDPGMRLERLMIATLGPTGGYRQTMGIVGTMRIIVATITFEGALFNTRMTELAAVQEQDTWDIYAVVEDTQDRQTQIYQTVGTLVDDTMLCSLLSIMGYSQLADCIDLLFRLATQYRSFVQILAMLYSLLSVTSISQLVWLQDLSDIGSPRADDHEFLELPYIPEDPYVEAALQALPSPDFVPGPEEPEHAPPLPDYVPGAEHADDEIVAKDQPYAEDASPIAQSPDSYVPNPEEDDDEDPEEDPIDYPADGGDDGDDEMDIEEDEDADMDIDADEEDEDDEMDVEIDEEAEEEHSAPAYPVVVALPATAPSAEETEPFETDESAATPPPHPAYRMTARITIPEPLPVPAWSDSEVARLLAISSPPASPLSPWSSSPPQIPFPLSPPSPVLTAPPPSPIRSLGYRAAMIRMRAEAAATSHSLPLPPPFILSPTRPDAPPPMPTSAPTSLPPLLLPSASRGEDRPEVNLPPRERLGIALGPRYEVGESSAAAAARPAGGLRADYGFVATMDREIRRDPERYG
ncbi:hypothetical protein Tco_1154461 [Tanacetum coccineum]